MRHVTHDTYIRNYTYMNRLYIVAIHVRIVVASMTMNEHMYVCSGLAVAAHATVVRLSHFATLGQAPNK